MKISNARIFWNVIWLLIEVVSIFIFFPMLWVWIGFNTVIFFIVILVNAEEDFTDVNIMAGVSLLNPFELAILLISIIGNAIINFNDWINKPKKQKPSYPPIDKGDRHKA